MTPKDASYFYNLAAHALMDFNESSGGLGYRLRDICTKLKTLMDTASPPACNHRIADATNEHVQSGYYCVDCGALFASAVTKSDCVDSDELRIDWCVKTLNDISKGGREKLGDAYPQILMIIDTLKRVLQKPVNRFEAGQSSQPAPVSDGELTAIYDVANGHDGGKMKPITTAKIFAAMRACLNQYTI